MQKDDVNAQDDKFISSIVCRNIHRLLTDKYPTFEFTMIKGLCYDEEGRSHSHSIMGPGFQITVKDICLTVSKPKPQQITSITNELFELVISLSNDSVKFDLADPDSIDQLLAHIDQLITSLEAK
jgi:hypothetical protein